jgi:hypothetical protein
MIPSSMTTRAREASVFPCGLIPVTVERICKRFIFRPKWDNENGWVLSGLTGPGSSDKSRRVVAIVVSTLMLLAQLIAAAHFHYTKVVMGVSDEARTGANGTIIGAAIAISAGTFLAVATSDILPQIRRENAARLAPLIALFVGLGVSWIGRMVAGWLS